MSGQHRPPGHRRRRRRHPLRRRQPTVRRTTRPLALTGHVGTSCADAVGLTAEAEVDRAGVGLTWNRMGVIKGAAVLSVAARFVHRD
ncbi:hypothetical protein [Actinacidiphila sp. bgisy160]|uniref:hypothetical protein n=1 Tax=Actinacidiphila sp. bgisy160 TaxID=3413796 RepID=UPI003D7352C6